MVCGYYICLCVWYVGIIYVCVYGVWVLYMFVCMVFALCYIVINTDRNVLTGGSCTRCRCCLCRAGLGSCDIKAATCQPALVSAAMSNGSGGAITNKALLRPVPASGGAGIANHSITNQYDTGTYSSDTDDYSGSLTGGPIARPIAVLSTTGHGNAAAKKIPKHPNFPMIRRNSGTGLNGNTITPSSSYNNLNTLSGVGGGGGNNINNSVSSGGSGSSTPRNGSPGGQSSMISGSPPSLTSQPPPPPPRSPSPIMSLSSRLKLPSFSKKNSSSSL